jgi:hypothetical protein
MKKISHEDRKLLQMAAIAADYNVRWVKGPTSLNYTGFKRLTGEKTQSGFDVEVTWNPLHVLGDALALAIDLRMTVQVKGVNGIIDMCSATCAGITNVQRWDDDVNAAVCRAIVVAAAECNDAACRGELCPNCHSRDIKHVGNVPDGMNLNNAYDCQDCQHSWEGY